MDRAASHVVERLLYYMEALVRNYAPGVRKTGVTISEIVNGTAFFPGGSALRRGNGPFGGLPDLFPDAPVMFVAHNFDSIPAYEKCVRKGGEARTFFWRILLDYLCHAGISPEQCFFTNALMGLKPGSAVGAMPAGPGYHDECQAFLKCQVEIVSPSLIVALGQKARERIATLRPIVPWISLLHPSARELKPLATRRGLIGQQGEMLRRAYASVQT
jgi:hypothetical protein